MSSLRSIRAVVRLRGNPKATMEENTTKNIDFTIKAQAKQRYKPTFRNSSVFIITLFFRGQKHLSAFNLK